MTERKQRLTLTTAALLLLPLAAACGTAKAGSSGSDSAAASRTETFTGVRWNVDTLTVDGTAQRPPDGTAHLKIGDDGKVEGSLGCNMMRGDATVEGDSVRFGDEFASTAMACEGSAGKFEMALGTTLRDGPLKADADGEHLTLTTDDGDRVALTKEENAPLYGTTWTVTALGNADGTSESLPYKAESEAYLTFDKKTGKVSGSLSCNTVNATATVSDGHITLGTPSTTKMMCDGSLIDVEMRLLRLFDSTVAYEVNDRTLTLTSENGETVTAGADG